MTQLNSENLTRIQDRVPVPAYHRARVRPGIVHFGVGGFHRAHQAVYLDSLMNAGRALDWGIVGVGTQPQDRRMQSVMAAQDCLYTTMEMHSDGSLRPRVIGSVIDYLFAPMKRKVGTTPIRSQASSTTLTTPSGRTSVRKPSRAARSGSSPRR